MVTLCGTYTRALTVENVCVWVCVCVCCVQCQNADDWEGCRESLIQRYRFVLSQAQQTRDKGDCEEECDDKGCQSLSAGNRRVLGFGVRIPREEL